MNESDKKDAKRWLIIGAHQAGASDKKIAKMCGVSQPTVRRIILNFKTTGSPCISKKLSRKEKTRLVAEYDDEGNLIDSDEETLSETVPISLKQKIRSRRPSAKDLITYVLNKAQQAEKKQSGAYLPQEHDWRPPTPPRDPQQNPHEQIQSNRSRTQLSPPISEPSISPKTQHESIKGFETWTLDDDKILMSHVLTRLSGCRWNEAELKLRGRHNADECEKRWEILRSLLVKGAEKSGTRGW